MKKKEIQRRLLSGGKTRFLWFRKLFFSDDLHTEHYWKLKDLLGKSFKIELHTHNSWMVRSIRVKFLDEYRVLQISKYYDTWGRGELREKIDESYRGLYEEYVDAVRSGKYNDLRALLKIIE